MKNKVKKTAIIAAAVIAAALIAVFFNRSKIIIFFAERNITNGSYSSAQTLLNADKSEYAQALKDYIELRRDIKKCYPSLLADYDREKIMQWRKTAESLASQGVLKNAEIKATVKNIFAGTGLILSVDSAYADIEDDVDCLLDIFSEYNRLHIQKNGENAVFTLREEYAKIDRWQAAYRRISNFAEAVPDYEKVYLLSYFIKEAQSEIVQIKNEMDAVSSAGHGLDETVRYSDNTARNFPEINNGNGTVISFRNKADYKKYLLSGIRSRLVSAQLLNYCYGDTD
ncbi:MAG: hypothetical protein IJK60_08265 [Clostridia bacterium]|nr:hypothetical protein [Clostridia bacterium]